jgi:hypothetical protein
LLFSLEQMFANLRAGFAKEAAFSPQIRAAKPTATYGLGGGCHGFEMSLAKRAPSHPWPNALFASTLAVYSMRWLCEPRCDGFLHYLLGFAGDFSEFGNTYEGGLKAPYGQN